MINLPGQTANSTQLAAHGNSANGKQQLK